MSEPHLNLAVVDGVREGLRRVGEFGIVLTESEAQQVTEVVADVFRRAGLLAEGDIQYTGHGRTFVIEEGELQPGEATAWRRLSKWIPMPVVDTETRDEQ